MNIHVQHKKISKPMSRVMFFVFVFSTPSLSDNRSDSLTVSWMYTIFLFLQPHQFCQHMALDKIIMWCCGAVVHMYVCYLQG